MTNVFSKLKSRKKLRRVGLALASLTLGFVSSPLYAATYNFYFNNTEQGPGSTATPQLNVQGSPITGSAQATTPQGTPPPYPPLPGTLISPPPEGQSVAQTLPDQAPETSSEPLSPNSVPVTPPPIPQVVPPAPLLDSDDSSVSASVGKKKSWWSFKTRDWVKISVLGGMLRHDQAYYSLEGFDGELDVNSVQISQNESMSIGGELSILPSRYLSLNGWGGIATNSYDDEIVPFWGGDIRVIPVRVGLFGMDNFLELSAGIGATSLAAGEYYDVSGYAVANATFGLGMDDVFLSATVKANKGFVLAEAGVGYRF
jgi:hypothetical protein